MTTINAKNVKVLINGVEVGSFSSLNYNSTMDLPPTPYELKPYHFSSTGWVEVPVTSWGVAGFKVRLLPRKTSGRARLSRHRKKMLRSLVVQLGRYLTQLSCQCYPDGHEYF